MSISRAKFLLFLIPALAWGQGSQLPKYTVATLPSASSHPTSIVEVIDGTSGTDCTVGGGSTLVLCKSNAGSWTAIAGGGSGTIQSSPQFQLCYFDLVGTNAHCKGDSGITTDGSGSLTAKTINLGNGAFTVDASGNAVTASTIGKSVGNVFYADQYAGGTFDCGIMEAASAAVSNGSHFVQLPKGGCVLNETVTVTPGITYNGYGGNSSQTDGFASCGTTLESSSFNLFTFSTASSVPSEFRNMCLWSRSGAGDIFSIQTSIQAVQIHDIFAIQDNTTKSFITSNSVTNSVLQLSIYNTTMQASALFTTPLIDLIGSDIGQLNIHDDRFLASAGSSTNGYFLSVQGDTSTHASGLNVFRNLTFEPPSSPNSFGGAMQLINVGQVLIDNAFIDDTLYTPTAASIYVVPVSTQTNGTTGPITIINSSSIRGTATFPDLYVKQSSPSQVNLTGDFLGWVAGDSGSPFSFVNINSSIQNFANAIQANLLDQSGLSTLVLNTSPTSTTLTGTSGSAVCSQSLQGTLKTATCFLNGYAETGAAQTYTFPKAFSSVSILQGTTTGGTSCGTYTPTTTTTVLTLPANAAMTAETCSVTLIGQ